MNPPTGSQRSFENDYGVPCSFEFPGGDQARHPSPKDKHFTRGFGALKPVFRPSTSWTKNHPSGGQT